MPRKSRSPLRLVAVLAFTPLWLGSTDLPPEATCNEEPGPTAVRLRWVEPGTGVARPADGKASLQVDNAAGTALVVDLVAVADLDGRRVRKPVGTWTVPGRGSQKVEVGIPASAAEVGALQSSGRLYVSSTVRSASGAVLESPHAVPIYFHPDMDGVVVLYPRAVLMATFAGGDFRGSLDPEVRRPQGRTQFLSAGLPAGEIDDFGLDGRGRPVVPTPTERAPQELVALYALQEAGRNDAIDDLTTSLVKLCFTLPAHVDDQAFGDLGKRESWWARGLVYAVYQQGTDTLLAAGYLPRESRSCFWWPNSSGPITVETRLESKVGGTGGTFHVATFDTENDAVSWAGGGNAPMATANASISPGLYSGGSTHSFELDHDVILSTGHATVINGLQRLEELTPRNEVFNRRIAPYLAPGGSSASIDHLKLTDDENKRRKFVYMHEVGHIFHQHFRGEAWGSPIEYTWVDEPSAGDDHCPGANDLSELTGEHALRSLERSAESYGEGIAHFLATVGLSSLGLSGEAEFKYYKQSDVYGYDYDLVTLRPSADTDVDGGTPDYLHNVCGCVGSAGPVPAPDPVDWPCEEVGVELDWLRFYWAYFQAEPQDPRPSLLEIMEQAGAEYVWGTSNAFDQLMDHVPPAFEERWRCMGCDFGVGGCDETCP